PASTTLSLHDALPIFGRLGQPSHRIGWDEVVEYQPEIIVLSPCGFDVNQVMEEAHVLGSYQGWEKIPALLSSRIYAVNASAYFRDRKSTRLNSSHGSI